MGDQMSNHQPPEKKSDDNNSDKKPQKQNKTKKKTSEDKIKKKGEMYSLSFLPDFGDYQLLIKQNVKQVRFYEYFVLSAGSELMHAFSGGLCYTKRIDSISSLYLYHFLSKLSIWLCFIALLYKNTLFYHLMQ